MPIDFNIGDEVKHDSALNTDNSACLRLQKPDGSHVVLPMGVRPNGRGQLFQISEADAAALGLDRDPATGFLRMEG